MKEKSSELMRVLDMTRRSDDEVSHGRATRSSIGIPVVSWMCEASYGLCAWRLSSLVRVWGALLTR